MLPSIESAHCKSSTNFPSQCPWYHCHLRLKGLVLNEGPNHCNIQHAMWYHIPPKTQSSNQKAVAPWCAIFVRAKVRSRIRLSSFLVFIVRSLHPSKDFKVIVPISGNKKHHSSCWVLGPEFCASQQPSVTIARMSFRCQALGWFRHSPLNGIHHSPVKRDWLTDGCVIPKV